MNMTAHIRYAPRSLALTRIAAAGALLLFAVLVLSEAARAFGYTDSTPRVVRAAFVLFTVLAAGAAFIEHYIAATCELQRLNTELERRIAEKSEEIKATYACVEEAKQEWALMGERQRILADMHDGVGASLIGLLRHVQSGNADRASIERWVQEASAGNAHRNRRSSAAGGRYRSGAGQPCAIGSTTSSARPASAWSGKWRNCPRWAISSPPPCSRCNACCSRRSPTRSSTRARSCLRLSARARDRDVEIRIEDDGRGFDPSRRRRGTGTGQHARAGAADRRASRHPRAFRRGDGRPPRDTARAVHTYCAQSPFVPTIASPPTTCSGPDVSVLSIGAPRLVHPISMGAPFTASAAP